MSFRNLSISFSTKKTGNSTTDSNSQILSEHKNKIEKKTNQKTNFFLSCSPATKYFLTKKHFRNLKYYQENRHFDRYFLLCCERQWAFPYFKQFFELLRRKKRNKKFLEIREKKKRFLDFQLSFSLWYSFTVLEKENRKIWNLKVMRYQ